MILIIIDPNQDITYSSNSMIGLRHALQLFTSYAILLICSLAISLNTSGVTLSLENSSDTLRINTVTIRSSVISLHTELTLCCSTDSFAMASFRFTRSSLWRRCATSEYSPSHEMQTAKRPSFVLAKRGMSSSRDPLARPSPPPLPRAQQREFEELIKTAQTPLAHPSGSNRESAEADLALHPDAPSPVKPEFEGDVNPVTGEKGGPKREPVGRWGEGDGDWNYKGRVSDF